MFVAGFIAVGLASGYLYYRRVNNPSQSNSQGITMTSFEAAEEQMRLEQSYDSMEKAFIEKNLNLAFIASIEKYYEPIVDADLENGRTKLRSKGYEEVDGPTSRDMCRLIVLPMNDDKSMAQRLYDSATTVLNTLPSEIKVFRNPAEILHVTLFHTSRVEDPFPTKDSKEGRNLQSYLESEKERFKAIIESTPCPRLTFQRFLLGDSGVLLALWFDETESVANIRRQFRTEYPKAPTKQTNIIHTSIFRILSREILSQEIQNKIVSVCKDLSKRLHGLTWTPKKARIVIERHFSTIEGPFIDVSFRDAV